MARVVKFYETGGPEVLKVEDADPGEPGAGEALVEINAIGLNRGEAAMRGGHYIAKPRLPSRIGAEASGRIVKLGPGAEGWAIGDLVFVVPMFAPGRYGVYASQAVLPLVSLVKLPDGLDPVTSAATWTAFLTAWGALIETASLSAGKFVIITAASSSVGLAAIQVARDIGATPIAVTRKSSKADALTAAGAAHVIATEESDLAKEIATITAGKGVPLIFDSVAGPFVDTLSECLADEGVLMIYGGLANQPATFPRQLAIRRNLTMRGYNFIAMVSNKARFEKGRSYILERVRDGRFKMPIARTFALDNVVEAHRYLESNQQIGKIVMLP